MFPTDMSVQFRSADEFEAACIAPMTLFFVVNPSCVLLKRVFYLELLFTLWTLKQLKRLLMVEFDVPPQHELLFKSQVTSVTGKLPLDVVHLNVTLQSFLAAENLRALLTLDLPQLGFFSHVCFQSHIGEELLSTVRAYDAFSIVSVHVNFKALLTSELTTAVRFWANKVFVKISVSFHV